MGKKGLDTAALSASMDLVQEETAGEELAALPAQKRLDNPAQMSDDKRTRFFITEIDPRKCKRWAYADRFDEWFSYDNCQDLIESIAASEQDIPGVVRVLKNDPEGYSYEVIAGSRRHFAAMYLTDVKGIETPFKAIIKSKMSDEQAAAYMDKENRDKADISGFERCVSYRRQLGYVDGVPGIIESLGKLHVAIEGEMINENHKRTGSITKSALSQMVSAGELNEIPELISLFAGRRIDIKWSYAYNLMQKWNKGDVDNKAPILSRAKELVSRASEMEVDAILKDLIAAPERAGKAPKTPAKSSQKKYLVAGNTKSAIKVKASAKDTVLRLPNRVLKEESEDELIKTIREAIKEMKEEAGV